MSPYHYTPDEPDPPCEICGHEYESCICPTCPVCHTNGNPYCYQHHGLIASAFQIAGRQTYQAQMKCEIEELNRAVEEDFKEWLANQP